MVWILYFWELLTEMSEHILVIESFQILKLILRLKPLSVSVLSTALCVLIDCVCVEKLVFWLNVYVLPKDCISVANFFPIDFLLTWERGARSAMCEISKLLKQKYKYKYKENTNTDTYTNIHRIFISMFVFVFLLAFVFVDRGARGKVGGHVRDIKAAQTKTPSVPCKNANRRKWKRREKKHNAYHNLFKKPDIFETQIFVEKENLTTFGIWYSCCDIDVASQIENMKRMIMGNRCYRM